MKLSEALQKGMSKIDKQVKRSLLYRNDEGKLCGCALGAILVGAAPEKELEEVLSHSADGYSWLEDSLPEFESPDGESSQLMRDIWYHNDVESMDFGQIKNWLVEKGY